ncbi:MAG: nucleotide-diphospho-sugar transferase [Cytophagaceae bacterium]
MTLPLLEVPVLLLVFNRPDKTEKVLESLKKIRPKYLFVSADGPREDNPSDAINCKTTRDLFSSIDWECQIQTRYLDHNLGCKHGVSSGISWFFEQVEEGIILEDDCVVDPSFFEFAAELLVRYRNSDHVMHIAASNFIKTKAIESNTYHFSLYNHIWGWATWRRAWQHYHVNLDQVTRKEFKEVLKNKFERSIDRQYWLAIFDYVKSGNLPTWDYQWMFAMWIQNGIAITPGVNLVKNIGFGEGGTNTQAGDKTFSEQEAGWMEFPLSHPSNFDINVNHDLHTADHLFKVKKYAGTWFLKLKIAALLPVKLKNWMKRL